MGCRGGGSWLSFGVVLCGGVCISLGLWVSSLGRWCFGMGIYYCYMVFVHYYTLLLNIVVVLLSWLSSRVFLSVLCSVRLLCCCGVVSVLCSSQFFGGRWCLGIPWNPLLVWFPRVLTVPGGGIGSRSPYIANYWTEHCFIIFHNHPLRIVTWSGLSDPRRT